jgi:bifunctional non-homologous end joining protein LigD
VKHLAVRTENHPLEYLDFEDVIPSGNYGAGAMITWDTGLVRYLDGTEADWEARGKLDIELWGFKLRGRFALVETGKREKRASVSSEWLLFKKPDAHARTEPDVLASDRSVFSGLTVEELARAGELKAELVAFARRLSSRAVKRSLPLEPMLCSTDPVPLEDPARVYELKLDGFRLIAEKHDSDVFLRFRSGRLASLAFPDIVRAIRALPADHAVLDGEVVAFEDGRPNFARLLSRLRSGFAPEAGASASYLVFDVPEFAGLDLTQTPLLKRKELLSRLVRGSGYVRYLDHLDGDARPLLELCQREQLEGVVAKRKDSPYCAGPRRTPHWVKVKREREADFVVVGFTRERSGGRGLGALDIASYDGARLVHRGRVGSGFDAKALRALGARLKELASPSPTCAGLDAIPRTHVRPELVVRVRFLEFSEEGRLRHPVFAGIREGVAPSECREGPDPRGDADTVADAALAALREARATGEAPENADGTPPALPPRTAQLRERIATRKVPLTNPTKVFYPEHGFTKRDVVEYYRAVAPALLPVLRDRPTLVVRYPDGIHGKHFYQWNPPPGASSWVREVEIEEGDDKRAFVVDDEPGLLYLANLGTLPLHVLAWRTGRSHLCDFVTVDFDLGDHPLSEGVALALTLRRILERIELPGFPKTSGQTGLHVLIPLGTGLPFEAAKLLCELLGRLVVARHPDIATMERVVAKRGGRIYVDTGQTGFSRAIVAPYSLRAIPGATVSTPLFWSELTPSLDPRQYDLRSLPERLAKTGDPLAGWLSTRPPLERALARLEGLVREPADAP